MGYIEENDADVYSPTNFSRALTIPIIGDGYPVLSCSKFAEYMQKTNYATPSTADAGPYQYAFDTNMNMFEYLHEHPPLGKQFDHHMGGYRQGRPSWMDPHFYPVEKELIKAKFPQAPGRLVLQDIPAVIDGIQQLDNKIERTVHDFLTEQPIKGKNILKQIAGAMKRGYSKLLINENIIPDTEADWQATALDMMMMTLFASKERTLSDWRQLLESSGVGLKITRIWSVKHSQESLIECELV
ncbi:hypothetical protein N0V94_009154 [Neodidymelliopsis sp. IMI 364377]|nr:hypothetical protein N0V94_009154 [Neodidymelliopsis sp. IMI 364377]